MEVYDWVHRLESYVFGTIYVPIHHVPTFAAICRPKILSVVIVEHLSDVHRMVCCAVQQTRDSLLNITLQGTFITIQ